MTDPLNSTGTGRAQLLWLKLVSRFSVMTGMPADYTLNAHTVGDSLRLLYCPWDERGLRPYPVPSADFKDIVDKLRQLHLESDEGSFVWAALSVRGVNDSGISIRHWRDEEPYDNMQWVMDARDLRREQQRFPRPQYPAWWTDFLALADSRVAMFEGRTTSGASSFDSKCDRTWTATRHLQWVTCATAIASALGVIGVSAHFTGSSDDARLVCTIGDHRLALQRFSDERLLISGYLDEAAEVPFEDLVAGVPEWVSTGDLDDSLHSSQTLNVCIWNEAGKWYSTTPNTIERSALSSLLMPTSDSVARYIAQTFVAPDSFEGQIESETAFVRIFGLLATQQGDGIRPLTLSQIQGALPKRDGHDAVRSGEVDSSLDFHAAWTLLEAVGLAADAGPAAYVAEQLEALQTVLCDEGSLQLRVAIAGSESLWRWGGDSPLPSKPVQDRIADMVKELKTTMFSRSGEEAWWAAHFTGSSSVFTPLHEQPPADMRLRPSAYAEDLARAFRPAPRWVCELWTTQADAIIASHDAVLKGDKKEVDENSGPASPVGGLGPLSVIAGRWGAIAGFTGSLTQVDPTYTRRLPIRAGQDGLWFESDGVSLRLEPGANGRAVLSGSALRPNLDEAVRSDPVRMVAGLPFWLQTHNLHEKLLNHSALDVCWWCDGSSWWSSGQLPQQDLSDIPELKWLSSRSATVELLSDVVRGSKLASVTPAELDDFMASAEERPSLGQAKLRELLKKHR